METNQPTINEMDNNPYMLKEAKRSFSKLGLAFLIGSIVILGVQLAVVALVGAWKPEWIQNPTISLMVSVFPMYLIGMPLLIWLVKRQPAAKIEQHTMKAGHFALAMLMCFAVLYVSNIAGNVLTFVIGILKGSMVSNEIMDIATTSSMAVTFLYMVICAPIMEEYIFRKLIVDRTVRYGQGVAILLSGLMFGLFHGNLNQFVYAFTMGMFLTFIYVKTGKIKITIAMHMIVNFMGAIVSVLILKAMHYEELVAVSNSMDMQAMTEYMMKYLPGLMAYMVYVMFVLIAMVAGVILFIVFRKRFRTDKGEVVIPKGHRFQTVIVNPGMIAYCVLWIGMIIYQLLY